jgi:hypothetical protein
MVAPAIRSRRTGNRSIGGYRKMVPLRFDPIKPQHVRAYDA